MSLVSSASSLRANGPLTATVDHCSVTLAQNTRMSGHSVCSQFSSQPSTRAAPPEVVVMWK